MQAGGGLLSCRHSETGARTPTIDPSTDQSIKEKGRQNNVSPRLSAAAQDGGPKAYHRDQWHCRAEVTSILSAAVALPQSDHSTKKR